MQFPQRFGKYTLLKHIATGGMADIYLANMKSGLGFEKEVVIKRLRPEHAANPELVGMFLDEARTAANLTHPNIAQIFDLGEANGDYFIAMEYVRGVDLLRICSHGIEANNYLPLHHAVRIMANVCDALAYAHDECTAGGVALKVVHRDVSPTNILISYDGACKLIDFGIAKAKTQATLTKVGQIKGKFGYMAPEQCRGEPVDARTDIFAVGINLYEITLGRRLFQGASEVETIEKIEDAIVTPPIEVNARYPEMLSRIVMRSLAREPDERYQDARQMQIALEEFLVSAGLRSTKGMMAAYMRRLFRAQIADENAVLGALRVQARSMPPSAAPPVDDDADDVDQTVRIASSAAALTAEPTMRTSSSAVMQAVEQSTVEQRTVEQPTVEQPVAQTPVAQTPVAQTPVAQTSVVQPVIQPVVQPVIQPVVRPVVQPAFSRPVAQPQAAPVAWGGASSVVVDPAAGSAPGLRSAFSDPPAPAQAAQMNPWSALNTVSVRPPRRSRLDMPSSFAPPTEPNPNIMLDADDLKIRKPRSYAGLIMLLVIAGGGFALYTVMKNDADSERVRGNPNMTVAAPQLGGPVSNGVERPPPAKAMLRLSSTPPGARVSVNGNMVSGVTPTAVQVFQDGSATVHMMLEGHLPMTKRVAINGPSAEVSLALEAGEAPTGSLTIQSEPIGAEIWMDGQPIGKSPLQLEKVTAGMRTLRLRMAGRYDHSVLYDVAPDGKGRIFVRLPTVIGERTMATVMVESRPVGADLVRLTPEGPKAAGRTTGQAAVKINASINAPLHVQANRPKHVPAVVDLDVKDPYYTVYARLEPPVVHYGTLKITGSRGLTLYAGSEEVGKTPIEALRLKVGTHDIVIVDDESRAKHKATVTIAKNKTQTMSVTLKGGTLTVK